MQNIAVLLACFNRKDKTLAALDHLFMAHHQVSDSLALNVYLTDDGSTDGTGEVIKKNYPEIEVLYGDGNLFWAGGMRNSWREALKGNYDAFLLLNDDTNVSSNLFKELLNTHKSCLQEYGKSGIYIGSTKDGNTGELTYGGANLTNKFLFKYEFIQPNTEIQSCELGNANIMLVTKDVVNKVGILSNGYVHGVADYDYTLKAVKKKFPVVITPSFCGVCTNDHSDVYDNFAQKSFLERLKILKSPLGLDFKSNLNFMLRHFPYSVPFVIFSAALKLILPNIYVRCLGNR